MKSYEESQIVQVLRNVGSLGPCWLPAKYIQVKDNRHCVRTIECDTEEILLVDDDCVRQ